MFPHLVPERQWEQVVLWPELATSILLMPATTLSSLVLKLMAVQPVGSKQVL